MKKRCDWCENTFEQYVRYHDEEWGVPVHNDQQLFELLTLEGAQAGLSWSTILKKREGYRQAFNQFDIQQVAHFDEQTIQQLVQNPAIVRHELKIRSTIKNAQEIIEIQQTFDSFDQYIWSFVDGEPINNYWHTMQQVPAQTKISARLSVDLKKRGFKFIGGTIIYAFMQAAGLVNDHLVGCFRHAEIAGKRST